jgi:hypothetical protein
LLKLNADYPKWTAGVPDEKTAKLYAFVHAATWADDIKRREYGYTRDNVNSATAGQNIGYSDHNQHAYWHFKDINFSSDGTPLPPPGRSRHPSEAYDRGHRNAFPVTRTPGDLNQSCFGLPPRHAPPRSEHRPTRGDGGIAHALGHQAAEWVEDEIGDIIRSPASNRASPRRRTPSATRPSSASLTRVSYFVGACTGRSAGFSPFRMRST